MSFDPLSPEERSIRMSKIRNADTKPEKTVRKLVYGLGYRYRLHKKELPGCPDMVFSSRRKVIFVHGCFWHQHGCNQYRMPRSKTDFWGPKLTRNVERDKEVECLLKKDGWNILVVWECQLKDLESLSNRIKAFLDG